jgi:hypothetical protein
MFMRFKRHKRLRRGKVHSAMPTEFLWANPMRLVCHRHQMAGVAAFSRL